MTVPEPSYLDREPPALDLDDELLDALGRGDRPAGGDRLALMLAAWRDDLDEPADRPLDGATPGPETVALVPDTTEARANGQASIPRPGIRPPRPSVPLRSARPMPNRPARDQASGPHGSRRWTRRSRIAFAATVVFAVGLVSGIVVAAASNATPNSPLWPVSQLLYPERADRVGAQDALTRARVAASEGRLGDARRLIDEAQALISKVADPAERTRLQSELDQIRQLVSSAGGSVQPGGTPAPQPRPSGGPEPTGTSGPLPGPLPSAPLPTGILPSVVLPSLPLPTSLLPSLPLIQG
jgi:hypothetical protein